MTDERKQPGSLSDLALERVMRDIFSGVWCPRLQEAADGLNETATQETPSNEEAGPGSS